ncbi:MAG: hypothetical protein AABZ53_16365 [Planctomycetota bacterium]
MRKLLGERGIRPEALSGAEDTKKLERRVESEKKTLAGKGERLPGGGKAGGGGEGPVDVGG